jgi:SAM-dependent methyltransferase
MPEAQIPPDLQKLKARLKETWMAGDFGQIARYTAVEAEQFIARLQLEPGTRVLDVACGTGNLAIPAARAGAVVTGVDIATNLVQAARARAREEELSAQFEEGDAESLPYADGTFDCVVSMFGAMFAPRPDRVAAELARVCRPGGRIAMANWTPQGFVGDTFRLMANHVPPPEGIPAPVLWGDEEVVRQRFAATAQSIETRRKQAVFDYPFSPSEVVQFFRTCFGPTQVAFARLDAAGQAQLSAELEHLWARHNQGDQGHTVVEAEYLEVYVQRNAGSNR